MFSWTWLIAGTALGAVSVLPYTIWRHKRDAKRTDEARKRAQATPDDQAKDFGGRFRSRMACRISCRTTCAVRSLRKENEPPFHSGAASATDAPPAQAQQELQSPCSCLCGHFPKSWDATDTFTSVCGTCSAAGEMFCAAAGALCVCCT